MDQPEPDPLDWRTLPRKPKRIAAERIQVPACPYCGRRRAGLARHIQDHHRPKATPCDG